MRRCRTRSLRRHRRSRRRSTRSPIGCVRAVGSSTSERARRGGSPRSTRPSAKRRSPLPRHRHRARRGRRCATPPSSRRRPRTIVRPVSDDPRARSVSAADAVVGVSASGTTPYVLGALEAARAPTRSPRASSRPEAPSSASSSSTRSRSSSARSSSRARRASRPGLRRSSCSTRSRPSR